MAVNREGSVVDGTYSGPEPGWWGAVFPGLTGAVPHHLTVDGTADTVVQFHVELGKNIRCRVDRGERGKDEDVRREENADWVF